MHISMNAIIADTTIVRSRRATAPIFNHGDEVFGTTKRSARPDEEHMT